MRVILIHALFAAFKQFVEKNYPDRPKGRRTLLRQLRGGDGATPSKPAPRRLAVARPLNRAAPRPSAVKLPDTPRWSEAAASLELIRRYGCGFEPVETFHAVNDDRRYPA
jgi:hypothetical protein